MSNYDMIIQIKKQKKQITSLEFFHKCQRVKFTQAWVDHGFGSFDSFIVYTHHHDSLVQDCSISTALAVEILQSWTRPSSVCDDEFHKT